MTTACLLFDSTKNPAPSEGLNGERRDLPAALFLLSRKLLALQAMVNRNGSIGSASCDEAATIQLLNLCVSQIIAISKMPNTFPGITQELLDAFESLYRVQSQHPTSSNGLTGREVEVVRHLAEGKCNKEIAAALGISAKTVEHYRTNAMFKLHAHSVVDLLRFAALHKLISLG